MHMHIVVLQHPIRMHTVRTENGNNRGVCAALSICLLHYCCCRSKRVAFECRSLYFSHIDIRASAGTKLMRLPIAVDWDLLRRQQEEYYNNNSNEKREKNCCRAKKNGETHAHTKACKFYVTCCCLARLMKPTCRTHNIWLFEFPQTNKQANTHSQLTNSTVSNAIIYSFSLIFSIHILSLRAFFYMLLSCNRARGVALCAHVSCGCCV